MSSLSRSVWNAVTSVEPYANVSGSTSVAWAAVGALAAAKGSELTWVTPVWAEGGPEIVGRPFL